MAQYNPGSNKGSYPFYISKAHIYTGTAYGDVRNPASLFQDHLDSLAEDFCRMHNDPGTTHNMKNETVRDIELHLNEMGQSLWYYAPLQYLLDVCSNRLQRSIMDKKFYSNNEERESFLGLFDRYCSQMNQGQHEAVETLVNAYDNIR
jgi:hypothetical protein